MPIIFEPSKSIIATCDLIDQGIAQFLSSLNNHHPGKYEFEVECLLNITYSIRIFESIIELARKDLVHVQSAPILSRSIFEALIKVSWILYPPDIFECETRYVAQLETECTFLSKWIKEYDRSDADSQKYQNTLEAISDLKKSLSELLKEKGYRIPKLLNVRETLKSLNEERKYMNYMILSQYTPATHYAGNIYRENLGTEKILSENVKLDDWKFVFVVCWPVFELATEFYAFRTEGNEKIYSMDFKDAVRAGILSIA